MVANKLDGGSSFSGEGGIDNSQMPASPVPLENCSICLEALDPRGQHRPVQLRCGHVFGSECIAQWLQTDKKQRRCPQCQATVDRNSQRDLAPILGLRVQDGGEEAQLTGTLEAVRAKRQRLERANEAMQREHDQLARKRDSLMARVRTLGAPSASASCACAAASATASEAGPAATAPPAAADARVANPRSEDEVPQLSSSQQARMLANREAALARLRAGRSRSRPSSPAALEPQRQPSA